MKIKRKKSTYSLVLLLLLALLVSCGGSARERVEISSVEAGERLDPRGFDPLELARDKEIIPVKYPRSGSIEGSESLVQSESGESDSSSTEIANVPRPTDTIQNQIYRVQLLTSKVYGEARYAVRVAEEIFDQLVYLDYEVPYYKVRVGDFAGRDLAEGYQQKAKAAGYSSCWVVVVNVAVKEAAPLYDEMIDQSDTDLPTDEELQANDEPR